jgi:anti-anti-sigma regulatory factor
MLKQHITSDIPFVEQQFNKQVDQTVMEAKGEIDAHITHVVQATGLKAIKNGDYDLAGVIEHTEDKEED